jgi:hypothetical protein
MTMLATTVLLGSLLCVALDDATAVQTPRVDDENQDQHAGPKQETPGKPRSPRNPPMEKSFKGPLPELTAVQTVLVDELRRDVDVLARKIGERNLGKYQKLVDAADFIEKSFRDAGYERVERQGYDVKGRNCDNLEVEMPGSEGADEIVVVGAHYDSKLWSIKPILARLWQVKTYREYGRS